MTIRIYDKIYINVNSLNNYAYELCKDFTYANPDYHIAKSMKFSTKNIPTHLKHYDLDITPTQQILTFPRGGWLKITKFFNKHGFVLRYCDDRIKFSNAIDCSLEGTVLESHQHNIINTIIKHNGGLIEAEPGAGKTIASLGLICELKQPTLILVHEHRLRTQWEVEITERLKGTYQLGRYDGDKKIEGNICIGIINTVYNMYKEDKSFLEKFGLVIIDECHRVPADMFLKVVNNIPSFYRVGITGTVKRKDNKEILLYDTIGPLLLSIKPGSIKHRVTYFDYKVINTGISFEVPARFIWVNGVKEPQINYTKLLTHLIEDDERNALILDNIIKSIEEGHLPLILSDRVKHCKFFHTRMKELGYYGVLLIGETRKSTNWEEIRKDETIAYIVAQSSIAAEALDYPRLSALHVPCPSSNLPKLKQKIGRIRREQEGKALPCVYDYVDNLVYFINSEKERQYPLRGSGQLRINFYKKLQKEYNACE